MKLAVAEGLPTEFDEMLVMGEDEDLGAFGQGTQLRENRFGAFVIEGDQQVVQYEWHGIMLLEIPIERRQPKCQV